MGIEPILFLVPIAILSVLLGILRGVFRGEKIGKISTIADLIVISILIVGFTYFLIVMSSGILLICLFLECFLFYEVLIDLKNNY
ncbi:MAG: hypothetical protein ABS916_09780 [Carnobacterium sp.]|uniref:hypothetical protein n=1 Tax=Carnobacterium sp. TaxID=48221 RepID=UPI003315AC96